MEVHQHTHTGRKKWYHYFWEFFMLFLAVFCGFIAENIREHYVEHKREKELAMGLYKDIKADTAQLNNIIRFRKTRAEQLDSLFILLNQPPGQTNKTEIYHLALKSILFAYSDFSRSNGTTNELKNSGYLRYFNGTSIPGILAKYDAQVEALEEFEKLEFNEITDRYVPFLWQHFDANALEKSWYERQPLEFEPRFIDMTETNLNYLKSFIISLKLINRNIVVLLNYVLKAATPFLEDLGKEYHTE